MPLQISDVISSKARFKVLKCLEQQFEPISLREVISLTELPIRSVELALKSLVKERILKDYRKKRSHLFQLREDHLLTPSIKSIFQALRNTELEQRAKTYTKEANKALAFAQSAIDLFGK
ncbi:MAG: hypothetical protein J0L93_06805 [Deltaproteobacteria bacterium]|nr:hypothetical protein [Deltaproteobacteria bacterium]